MHDASNLFGVTARGDGGATFEVLMDPEQSLKAKIPVSLSRDQALNLAAWLLLVIGKRHYGEAEFEAMRMHVTGYEMTDGTVATIPSHRYLVEVADGCLPSEDAWRPAVAPPSGSMMRPEQVSSRATLLEAFQLRDQLIELQTRGGDEAVARAAVGFSFRVREVPRLAAGFCVRASADVAAEAPDVARAMAPGAGDAIAKDTLGVVLAISLYGDMVNVRWEGRPCRIVPAGAVEVVL